MGSQGSLIPISDTTILSSGWPRRASKVRPLAAILISNWYTPQACASCRYVFQNDHLKSETATYKKPGAIKFDVMVQGLLSNRYQWTYSLIDTSPSRPCGGCAKKGYSVEQCKYGCEPCRRARVRCEDGKPCQRCRMMQLECRDETTMPILRSSTPPVAPRSVRGSADRAKLACSSCRRDNKKVLPGFEH